MDVFESGNFYDNLHPAKGRVRPVSSSVRRMPGNSNLGRMPHGYRYGDYTNFVGDDQYANANKKETNYDATYRAQYPAANTESGLNNVISRLQSELNTWNKKTCPKQTIVKAILTGGLANATALQCANEKKARVNALSGIINDYQSQLSGIQQQAKDAAAAQAAAAAAAAAPPVTTPTPGVATTPTGTCMQYNSLGPLPSSSTGAAPASSSKLLMIGGAGLVTVILIGVLLSRKGTPQT